MRFSLQSNPRTEAKVDVLMAMVDALETQLAAARTTATALLDALVAELATDQKHPMPANSHADQKPPVNHVFVDFENMHKVDVSVIGSKTVCFTLLLGAQQKKLDAGLVEKLMEHAASVKLVRLTSSGKNALDFTLAYYVGRAAMADPSGYFHIVSKDAGFDPLIEHLKSLHIHACRHRDFSTLAFSMPPESPVAPPEDLFARALEHLRKNTNNRPKRKKTLVSHLRPLCGKTADEAGVLALVERLCTTGQLSFGEKGSVTYHI